jgi:putative addiction module component (TIGR02574 family)
MSRTLTDVWKPAADLTEQDRAALACLLIESLEGEPDPDVDTAWAAEIERRVAALDAGTVMTVPWEQVRQRLLDRLHTPPPKEKAKRKPRTRKGR